ncbi:MAG: DedA family protein [Alphaproteobacteria bacterium]|nr:DedA family protein [Alphaproteobacteria bacterium]
MAEPLEIRLTRDGPIRLLYDWSMRHASGPYAFWVLGAIGFTEASFFPIPPDAMLVSMVLADRRRAFVLALWCTLTSVLGGMAAYGIGAFLWSSVGHWLIDVYGYGGRLEAFRDLYAQWGAAIILLKGLTPVPYKLVTLASGFAGFDFGLFVLLSAITRGGRFLLVAGLLFVFGEQVREFIEKRLELVTLAALVMVGIGFVLVRFT